MKSSSLPVGTLTDTTTSTIRGFLHSMAVDLGPLGYDEEYGYGLVQFGMDKD